ncbi:MAG: ABC transporter permease [Candidatus Bipolaricaulota bacterium]|nr:ABC transporter permease [Candidatus Bipolaricaulota bacterium]MBS3791023.1 ABC transporter permease [Candidatus Bipolaricaulota bacterium]
MEVWQYINSHWVTIGSWTMDHLWLILVSNSFAVFIGVSLGIFISGKGREEVADTVLYLAGIMMTIPSLALFGLLMPLLSALNLPSLGFLPAVIALILYGQLPILRNTYTAIREVDPAMIEAGRGMGMTSRQILLKIKLPLAVPVIMAGLRNAVVINIGIATIAVFIGARGLGVPIFRGLRTSRTDMIITGAVFVSVLALLVDGLLALAERKFTPEGLKK